MDRPVAMLENTGLQSQLDAQRAKSPAPAAAIFDESVQHLRNSGIEHQILQPGAQAPDFSLPDALGNQISLTQLLAHGPLAMTFYRGEWCPYCNLTLHAYQEVLPQIQELGAALVAISPQLPDHSLSMVEKHQLAFPVLSDVGNGVARQFGLVFTVDKKMRALQESRGLDMSAFNGDDSWELPIPGTFIIAPDRTIRFVFAPADYRQRLEPAELVAQLRAVTAEQQ